MASCSLLSAALAALALPALPQTYQQVPDRPQSTAVSPLGDLVLSPSALVVAQVGSGQQLHAYVDSGSSRIEVTGAAGIDFHSSDRAVVTVTATGWMTFVGTGQAMVTVSYSGSTADAAVNVDPGKLPSVEAQVGSAGGSLHFPDGTGIQVPPGVLGGNQMLSVEQVPFPTGAIVPPGAMAVSNAFDFQPSGMTFEEEVQVTLGYSTSSLPPGYDEESLLVHTLYGGNHLDVEAYSGPEGLEHLVESVNQSVDLVKKTVTVGAHHFSCRALLANLNPVSVTLTAPDGTQLDVLQVLKTQKPNSGADGDYGVPNCDDDGNGSVDDCGEFEGVTGSACVGVVDDVRVAIPVRNAANITHIVLHCTAGNANATFSGEVNWASSARNCYWAHYYVGKDGTIVQVSQDTEIAQHVKTNNTVGHAGNGIDNNVSIGIEIFNNSGVDNYPGRQVAAVVRLCDFLLRCYPTITRPSAADPDGNIITHAAQNPPGSVKTDPTNEFRTAVMGSPSLEEITLRALRTDTQTGIVNARGGDALGTGSPGNGGIVIIEMGIDYLASNFDDTRNTTQVGSGATQAIGGPDLMHVLVDGIATVGADTTLDLDGILYVGPDGVLDARGGFDGDDGRDLLITADGFALIEGAVLVNGTDKLGASEQPPFNQAPFNGGSGDGDGGTSGDFTFSSAAAGLMFVPSIVTRGGDGDSSPMGTPVSGGAGGDVTIRGNHDANFARILMLVRGHENEEDVDQAELGMPDYLPPPPPYNLMPVITAAPIASGSCPVSTSTTSSYVRPSADERLALGRDIESTTHQALGNVSLLKRGIVTVGGMGAYAGSSTELGGTGGMAGSILIENQTGGYIRFLDDVQLFAGSGAERVASVIQVASGSCSGNFKFFDIPSGCLGGRGAFNAGDGGDGGAAGSIVIQGAIWPSLVASAPTGTTSTPVFGFDSDNPNTSSGIQIGAFVGFPNEGFSTSSSAGSGGSPAGNGLSFPGWFGYKGADGQTIVNGSQYYP